MGSEVAHISLSKHAECSNSSTCSFVPSKFKSSANAEGGPGRKISSRQKCALISWEMLYATRVIESE